MAEQGGAVRWGVLSTANIGVKSVIPALRAAGNSQLVAVASRDVERARRVAAVEPGARAFGSYEELLADGEIEAVYIPLPNSLHAEWTIRALEAGKHVLCEKPLGATSAEVQRMFDASAATGMLLMEAFMYRFHPQIRWALEQIAAGAIGDVRFARSAFAFDIRGREENIRLKAALAGGSLMDVGCYPASFCRVVFGGKPQAVAARVTTPTGGEVERGVGATLDFGAGRLAMVDCSFELAARQFVEVIGEGGRLWIERPFTPGQTETSVTLERGDETLMKRFAATDQYRLMVEHFAGCVRMGAAPALTWEDSLAQAELLEMIYAGGGYRRPWAD